MPMDNNDMTRLEIALAHQQQQINDLSDMVTAQWREIETLKARLHDAHLRINELQATRGAGGGGEEEPLSLAEQLARERPPHY